MVALKPWLERTVRDGLERVARVGAKPVGDGPSPSLPPLSTDQVHQFQQQGFISLIRDTPPTEINFLRSQLAELFEKHAGRSEGAQLDTLGYDDDRLPPVQPEIINPANYAPQLKDLPLREWAGQVARELLGPEAYPNFEHAILKPAGAGKATPWHQDEASRGDGSLMYEQVSIWVPLQDVNEENGCLQYIPGTQAGPVLDHRPVGGDPKIHALECLTDQFDPDSAVSCPLPAGSAVVHHGRTLHSACANHSTDPRFAYVFVFRKPPGKERHEFPWQRDHRTAAWTRQRQWLRRGGLLTEIRRRVRRR